MSDETVTASSSLGVKTVAWSELQMSAADTWRLGDRLPSLPDTGDLALTADDPVMIFFSSGTTGPQKAVMLSNRNIHAQFVISWSAHFTVLRFIFMVALRNRADHYIFML